MTSGRLSSSIAQLFLGSSGAMVISAASVLLLSHFVSPDIYGVYQSVDAFALIFAIGGLLAIDKAMLVTRSPKELHLVMALAFILLGLVAIFAVGLYAILLGFDVLPDGGMVGLMIGFLVVSILSRGLFTVGRSHEIYHARFHTIAAGEVARALTLFAGRLAAALFSPNLLGLLSSGVLGSLVGAAVITKRSRSHLFRELKQGVRRRMRVMAWKYRRFILYESWGGFLRPLGQKGLILIVVPFYGPAESAIAALAFLLLLQPIQACVAAVVDVIRSRLSRVVRGDARNPSDIRYARVMPLGIIVVTPLALAAAIGIISIAAPVVVGEAWQNITPTCLAMAPLVYAMMIARALQSVYSQFQMQGRALLVDASIALGSLVFICVFAALGWPIHATYLGAGLALLCVIGLISLAFFAERWG